MATWTSGSPLLADLSLSTFADCACRLNFTSLKPPGVHAVFHLFLSHYDFTVILPNGEVSLIIQNMGLLCG